MGMRPKVCAVCGKGFVPTGSNQRYCSPECRKRTVSAQRREYYRRHKEEINARNREYHLRNKGRLNARSRRYWHEHKDEINARRRERRRERREEANARDREHRRERGAEREIRGLACELPEKPDGCGFEGSCLECPYPECVEE